MHDAAKGPQLARRHRGVAIWCAVVVAAMVGASFAASPLYSLLCKLTNFDGTPRRASAPSDVVLDRTVSVRFDANVAPGFPLRFEPVQHLIDVRLGETTLAFYRATNMSDKRLVGTSSFNVFPEQVGAFFNKLECFCFQEQALDPGQSIDLPVSFFVDPRMVDDKDAGDVTHITLSYTFYPVTPKPGLAEKPAKPDPATPKTVPGDGRAG